MLSKHFFDVLEKPFPISDINVRIGMVKRDRTSALPMFYLQADAVRQRLDKACEIENASWSYDFQVFMTPENFVTSNIESRSLSVKATIKVVKGCDEISRSSVGEEMLRLKSEDERGGTEVFKSAETDAFKRAAMRFGVGGYLRSLAKIWFPLDNHGHFVDDDEEIIKRVYDESGIVVDDIGFDDVILGILAKEVETKKSDLKKPCLFLDAGFCAEFEKKRGLKSGAWWTALTVIGVPVRILKYYEMVEIAKVLIGNLNDDNFQDALVLTKAMRFAYDYPSHFGRHVVVSKSPNSNEQEK